jgi:hypothetical protein
MGNCCSGVARKLHLLDDKGDVETPLIEDAPQGEVVVQIGRLCV